MKKISILALMILMVSLVLMGCSAADTTTEAGETSSDVVSTEENAVVVEDAGEEAVQEGEGTETEAEQAEVVEEPEVEVPEYPVDIDLQAVQPNELGEVMVIMYHSLGEENSAYIRTPEDFRKDLERLYAMGFRAVSLTDYVTNNITVEAGYTPVVLTFDDGHITNFNLIEENGEMVIDPNCTIGIMLDFYEEHPDFGLEGTFFLNGGTPFGQKEYVDYKLNYILEMGMDLGNHSNGHEDLSTLNAEQLQKTLGMNIQNIESIVSEKDFTVNTLALPFGIRPKDEALDAYVMNGVYEGVPYEHIAILKVGWKPEVAAIHNDFDYKAMNRVQSGDDDFQLTFYLDNYEANPSRRYISDGNPDIVTVKEKDADKVNMDMLGEKELRTYTVE